LSCRDRLLFARNYPRGAGISGDSFGADLNYGKSKGEGIESRFSASRNLRAEVYTQTTTALVLYLS
jgi:hypothetical protein